MRVIFFVLLIILFASPVAGLATKYIPQEEPVLILIDDSDPNQTVKVFRDGGYIYSRGIGALQATGTGDLIVRGCLLTLTDSDSRWRIVISGDSCRGTGKARLSYPPFGSFTITDRKSK